MVLLHLSDLHIGLRLMNRDMLEEQRYILNQIVSIAMEEKPDAILVAGDIYDKAVSSQESVLLFDEFVTKLHTSLPHTEIMMISGNHDSALRINLFRNVLKKNKLHMIGLPPVEKDRFIEKVTLSDAYGQVHFYLLPFVKPSMVRKLFEEEQQEGLTYDGAIRGLLARENIDRMERNVLVSHQFYLPTGTDALVLDRSDAEIKIVGNIDQVSADVLLPFDYAALGHLHKPMEVGKAFYRYCGTPMACSFDEAGQKKGILKVELMEKGNIRINQLPLLPMHSVRVLKGRLEEVLREPSEDFLSIIITDKEDLDPLDMQDRLHKAFPNLLELRRENVRGANYVHSFQEHEKKSPFELCQTFLGDLKPEEEALLREIINGIGEMQE